MIPHPRLMLALVLSLTAGRGESPASSPSTAAPPMPAHQAASPAGTCPLQGAALDKLTPYRWAVAQYKADRVYIPSGLIRIDYCELIGKDDKGLMKAGVMVNIAKGAQADAFAKYWRTVCAESLMAEARGKVQTVPGVPGGHQCVTPSGSSSNYWIESPGRTIQIEPETDTVKWAEIFPQLLAATAR